MKTRRIHKNPISQAKLKEVIKTSGNSLLAKNKLGYRKTYIPYLLILYMIDCISTKQISTLLGTTVATTQKYLSAMKDLGYTADMRMQSGKSYWHILPRGIAVLEYHYQNFRVPYQKTFLVDRGTYKVNFSELRFDEELGEEEFRQLNKPKHSILHDSRMTDVIMQLYELSVTERDFDLIKWYGPILTKWMYATRAISSTVTEYGLPEEFLIPRYWADAYAEIVVDDRLLQIHFEMDSSNQSYKVLADQKMRQIMKLRRSDFGRVGGHRYRPAGIMAFIIENDTETSGRADKIVRLIHEDFMDYTDTVNESRKILFANIDYVIPVVATRLDLYQKTNPVLDRIWSFSHDPNKLYSLQEVAHFLDVFYEESDLPPIITEDWRLAVKSNDLRRIWWGTEMGYPIRSGT